MSRLFSRELKVRCEVTRLAGSGEEIEAPTCRACDELLTLHQPEEDAPGHLLGTCGGCGAWFLVEVLDEGREAYLIDLRIVATIRAELESMREAKPEPTSDAVAPSRVAGGAARRASASASSGRAGASSAGSGAGARRPTRR